MVMPRSRSSGALSIWSKATYWLAALALASTLVMAAVKVVLPWSMCPIVPTFTCGFVRSYFAFAMSQPLRVAASLGLEIRGRPRATRAPPRGGRAPTAPTRRSSNLGRRLALALAGTDARRWFAGRLRHDLLGDGRRHFLVPGELHRVGGAALRHGPQIGGVAEHVAERHVGADHLGARARLHRDDPPAAAVEVADDGPHVLLGHDRLDLHDRLEQHGLGLPARLLEADRPGDLEGHFGGVDLVVGAVRQGHLQVDHRVAGEHARRHRLPDALLDRRDELLRHLASDDLVLEDEAGAGRGGRARDRHVAVLAAPAGLPHEPAFRLGDFPDRFPVRDLRLADVGLDLELPQQAVDDDLEVQLAHSRDQ